jgi:hypothetical protein
MGGSLYDRAGDSFTAALIQTRAIRGTLNLIDRRRTVEEHQFHQAWHWF